MFVKSFIAIGLVTTAATGRTACPGSLCPEAHQDSPDAILAHGRALGALCRAVLLEAAGDTFRTISFTGTRQD